MVVDLTESTRSGERQRHTAATTLKRNGAGHDLQTQPIFKRNSFAFDGCAPAQKEIAQFGRVIVPIEKGVETKKNFAAGGEVSLQVTQEKIPLR